MNSYLNVHVALEQMREDADDKRGMGPKVMIVGSPSSGKSTLSKILLSYALKCGRTPLFVDLDIGMGSVAIPGTVSAISLNGTLTEQWLDDCQFRRDRELHDDENSFPQYAQSYLSPGDIPLTYYYGFNTHQENFQYYKFLVNKLARDVEKRCESDLAARCSGMVIDTVGLIKPEGLAYDAVIQAIESFKVNAILVLSNPELYTALVEKFPSTLSTSPQILRLVSLPNLTPLNEDQVKTLTSTKIREYFYGIPRKLELSPHRINVPWALIKVVRVGEGTFDSFMNSRKTIAQEQPDTESTSPSSQSLHLPQTTASISEKISVIQVSDGNILIGSILSVVSESEELFVRTRTKSLQGSSAKEGKETGGEDGDDGMETVVWKCSEGFVYVYVSLVVFIFYHEYAQTFSS
ncbi:hypothetical protein BKA69DRAFT_1041789 [Paraphysoderma sedebokerense]|nr:hypothetical protein BKA69DRAFT_1041789 [Paraphysoderma sedebokerense]